MPAVCHPVHGYSPDPLQRVKADDCAGNGQESQCKQRKGRQKFAHEIKLQRADDSQQPPHPLSILILALDLTARRIHGHPPVLNSEKTLTCTSFDAATYPKGHVCNTCTIRHCGPGKNRWYASHILGSKRAY